MVTASWPAKAAPIVDADRGDLVLGLEGLDAEVAVARDLVEHVAGRRDRVGAEEDRPLHLHAGGDDAPGEGRGCR